MRALQRWRRASIAVIAVSVIGVACIGGNALAARGPVAKISRFNEYAGYSSVVYDGYRRHSEYVTARDGTKLAVDYYRPTSNGVLHEEKLPVVWAHTRYLRALIANDRVYDHLYKTAPALFALLQHGYVVAAADVRGAGASFGVADGWFTPQEAQDAYDITEWLAAQSWSSGKIGMAGRSYLGITQYFAAGEAPPSLKAIMPEMGLFDSYDAMYRGGIFGDWWLYVWSTMVRTMDISAALQPGWREAIATSRNGRIDFDRMRACADMQVCPGVPSGPVAPVDADTDGQLLARAIQQHKAALTTIQIAANVPYRDSRFGGAAIPTHLQRSPGLRLPKGAASHIAAYHIGGWLDGFISDTTIWQRNYPGRSRMLIGPWFHDGTASFDIATEYLRWFDYWLKDIDNGIAAEPAVTYFTFGAPAGQQWRTSTVWPLATQRITRFYFDQGRTGSVASHNDGRLSKRAPRGKAGGDAYTIDYTASVGIDNRWTSMVGGGAGKPPYTNMRGNAEKGFTYTSEPLTAATQMTGHPVMHLWLTSPAADVDVFAYLEEISPEGNSRYLTEGRLRASHRALSTPPYDRFGLPYHRSYQQDIQPLQPAQPTELVFDLMPTSVLFRAGSRIRLTITGADKDTFDTPIQTPPPTIAVLRSGATASYVELPIIPAP